MKAQEVVAEIRAEMARRQLTAAELARGLGVNERSLRRGLRGEREFSLAELDAILAMLGLALALERRP